MINLAKSLAVVSILFAGAAAAAPITPTFQTFGDLPQATFGGTGIATDPTAIAEFETDAGDFVTLGLTAHKRFANPALGNDGAGTFFATAGANDGTPGNSGTQATWNWAWFISVEPAQGSDTNINNLGIQLFYDLDPAAGTNQSDHGVFNFDFSSSPTLNEGSQNSTFAFLASGLPPSVIAPSFIAFNPNVAGEYTFGLFSSVLDGGVAIRVVVNAVPLPAPALLLLTGLAGLGAVRLRRRAA